MERSEKLSKDLSGSSYKPLEEMRRLLTRQRVLQERYNITNEEIYNINWHIETHERDFMQKRMIMNDEIKRYPIFGVNRAGMIFPIKFVKSTDDYNHYEMAMHHYIKYQSYTRDPKWFDERGIKQKLFLIKRVMHEHLEIPPFILSDEDFKRIYRIENTELLFNRKKSEY